jgi:hypothetical protein
VDRLTAMLRRAAILNERWFDKPQRSICRSAATALSSAMIAKIMAPPTMFNSIELNRKINTIKIFNINFSLCRATSFGD